MKPVAIITGAGSGLGRSLVDRFIGGGYAVAGLDSTAGIDTADYLAITADVTDPTAVRDAVTRVARQLGSPDVCVTAAGVYPRSTLHDFTVETYRTIFDVNVLGTLLVAEAFVAQHDPATEGALITVSSVDGIDPVARSLLYSASKAAVINLTKGLATAAAERNVRAFSVAPYYIATDKVRQIAGPGGVPADASTPEEVAQLIWSLSRPDALPLVTGQTIVARRSSLEMR